MQKTPKPSDRLVKIIEEFPKLSITVLGDIIAESEWSVIPNDIDGVSIIGSDFDATTSTVKAAGGLPGRIYSLVNEVVLDTGRMDSRSIVLRVEKR